MDVVQNLLHVLKIISDKLCDLLEILGNPSSTTTIDPEIVCISNDGGVTTTIGIAVFDTSVNPPITTLYLNGVEAVGYTMIPCNQAMKYDYEKEDVCVDGQSYKKIYVLDKTGDGTPNLIGILWLDQNDLPVSTPDPTLINNANCKVCLPTISDAFADDLSTLLPGTSFVITKPDCCKVLVATSAGSFTLREKETYYATTDFKCAVTIDSIVVVSGTCTPDSIHIISNFKG